jgi:hypothetical protein
MVFLAMQARNLKAVRRFEIDGNRVSRSDRLEPPREIILGLRVSSLRLAAAAQRPEPYSGSYLGGRDTYCTAHNDLACARYGVHVGQPFYRPDL